MTKEEILEGNKLIAEFLGYIYVPYTTGNYGGTHGWVLKNYKLIDKKMPKLFLGRTTKDLLYHKSWDWLMPCVEKINKINILELPSNLGTLKIKVKGSLYGIGVDNTIEDVWEVVVLFIKTYNEKCSE